MQLLSTNLSGKIREETLNGRRYLVAPLSMIVPGVLNGSNGPLYYPLEEIKKNVLAWNNMPIVLEHPTDEKGDPVSARSPEVLQAKQLGTVFNAHVNGKLSAEGWFDVEKTQNLSPATYNKLLAGEVEELSTGLFTKNIPVKNKSFNGNVYTHIATEHQPDHLAILPDTKGACSVADGCGVNVNEDSEEEQPLEEQPETDSTTNSKEEQVDSSKDKQWYELVGNEAADKDVATNEDLGQFLDWDNYESNECASCGPQCRCEGCQRKYAPAKEPALNWVSLVSNTSNMKKKSTCAEKGKIYLDDNQNVSPTKAKKILKDGKVHGKPLTSRQRKFFGAIASSKSTMNQENKMKLTPEQKTKIIDKLVSNEGDYAEFNPWTEDDREALEHFPDVKLIAMNKQREILESTQVENEEEAPATPTATPATAVENQDQPLSEEDWLAKAPENIRSTLNYARQLEKSQKDQLVASITKNENNIFSTEHLNGLSIEELQGLAALASNSKNESKEAQVLMPNYSGISGVVNRAMNNPDFATEDLDMAPEGY